MQIFRVTIILLFLAACNSSVPKQQTDTQPAAPPSQTTAGQPADTLASRNAEATPGPLVYITKEGDKYHTANCRYSKEAHTVSLQQAKAEGKTACDLCRPSSSTGEKQTRCTAKTSDGTQCKRMTTSASGKCFQHDKS
jgi:hypothetical protein